MANVYDALMAAANVVASRKKKEEEAAIAGAMSGISSPAKQTVTGSNNGVSGGAMLGVSQPYRQAYVDAVSTLKNRLSYHGVSPSPRLVMDPAPFPSAPSVSPSPVLAMAPGTVPSATPEMMDAMRKRDSGEPILSQPAGMQITEKRDPMAIYDKYVANPGLGLDGWDRSNMYDDMVAAGMPAQDAYAMRQQDYDDLLKQQGDLDAARQQLLDLGVVQEGDDVLKRMADHSTQMEKRTSQMAMDMIDQNPDFAEVAGGVDLAWPENYSYMTGNGVDNAYAAIADPNKFLAKAEQANILRSIPMMGQGPMVSTLMELPREYNIAMSMSDAEKDRYKYLYASDPVKATEYFYGLEPTTNQRRTQEMNQQLYEMGRGSTGGAIGATALSILAGPAKAKGYMKSFANMLTGQETDPYDPAFLASHASSSASGGARERTVNAFKDENGQDTIWSKAAGFGYDLVQNLGSNALNRLLGGEGLGTLLMMGSQSAGDSAMDAALRTDGDTQKAFLYGTRSGLVEIATEKIPMDKLEDMLSGKSKGLRALLAQAFMEAPGEMLSTIRQDALDRKIMGAQSNYETNVRKLMAGDPENGIAPMDEASARKEATGQFLDEVVYSGLLGFGSGVLSSSGAQMVGRILGNAPAEQQEAQKPTQEKTVKQKLDEAADAVIALREAEKPMPVEVEKTGDVLSFDQPMQAVRNTEEGGTSAPVQVAGIENGPDGKALLRVINESGTEERVGLDDVTLADEGMQDLLTDKAVQNMDAETLRGYLKDYNHDIATAPEYAKAYTGVYRRAATGMDYSTAVDGSEYAMRFLTAEAKRNAFEAGHAVSEAQAEKAKPKTTGGVVRAFSDVAWKSMDRSTRRRAAAQMEVLNVIGQRFGRSIRVVDSINADGKRANGMYNQKTGEITVALDADNNAYAYVAMHELTHSIRTEHQESWDAFSGVVRDALSASGQDADALVQYQMDRFGLDKDAAWEEVVCNTAPAMLQDEAVLTDLYNRDRTLFERVMEWVKNLIDDIRKAGVTLSERSQSWKQMDALKDDRESLQKLYETMKGILDGGEQDGTGMDVVKMSAKESAYDPETAAVKQQIANSRDRLNSMDVVASANVPENMRNKKAAAEWAIDLLKSTGYRVDRHGFGTINFSENEIRYAVNYADTEAEKAAFAVLPKVLKRGIEIGRHENHDNRAKKTVTFAAPVELNGTRGNMAVIVNLNKNRYYAHRIVLPDGSVFRFGSKNKETVRESQRGVTVSSSLADATSTVSENSIALNSKDVNRNLLDSNGNELSGVEVIDGSAVKYSLSSWTEEEKGKVQKALVKAGYDQEDAQKWIDDVNGVSAIVASDKARLDFDADPDQVMLKNNQEYVKTLDASTLCAKRLLYQGTFNAIQHRLPNTVMTSDLLLDLLNKMKEKGYETPCGICYVESRRRHLGKFAEQWLHGRPADKEQKAWAPYNGEYIPSLDELTTTDGLARLKEEHPQTYNDFVAKMASLGSSNPKIVELRTDYRGDIRKLSKSSAEKITRIGGLRVQSFSDFETPHLLDMMQAVLDMTSKGLTSQAYTKVPNFAWVFGDTGIKINLSLIAEGNGLDENGNLIFSSAEGMDFDEAMRLRERYSQNVGTIVVGANDAHIRAAMADPRIDFIIPFHRSGWGQNELKKVGVLQEYTDYQATQNERTIKGYKKNGTPDYGKPDGGNFYPIDYWDYSKTGDQNAETYLRLCEEDGRVPKFDQFLEKDADGHWKAPSGYWKMLIDFKMYDNDGNGAPQQQVMPHFNMEEAERVLAEYKGGANSLPVAQDIVDEFVAEIEKEDTLAKYSLSDYDENVQESDKLLEEMLTMTAAHRMTDGEAMRIASRAKKAAQSSMDTKELAGKIKRVFDYAERSGRNKKLDMPGFNAELLGLAEELLATSNTLDTEHEKAVQPVRDYLRKAEIALTDAQRQEAVKLAGTYNDYRRQVFGRVKLRQTGQSLSDVWGELSRMNPEMFPAGASEREMVRDLVNAVDMMAPIYQDQSGMNEAENVQRVAAEIGNLYMSLSGVQKAAAEYKEFGMKLRDYRQVNERFTDEHKKLFKRALEKVDKASKAEIARKTTEAKLNADAQAAEDMRAYRAAMQLKNLEWRETYRDKLKDTSRKQRYRAQITRMTNELLKRLEKPTDKKHVKAYLEEDLMAFLSSLDLGRRSKVTRSLGDRIRTLADRFANAQSTSENGSGQYMIDPELIDRMRTMADEMSALSSMDALNADQMRDMRDMVKAATHVVNAADYMFAMGKKIATGDVAERSMMEMSRKKDKKVRQGFAGRIDEMLSNGMLDSFRFFDRLGESAREVFTGIRKGFDRKVEKVSDAIDYVQRATKGFDKDLFRGDKAQKTTYKVSGGEISLTKAQVMELYCLSKRPQAQKHLYGGGIRTQDNANAVTLNEADVQQICSSLTDEEVKMAEKLQSYLVKECAVWGNETSMLLYGYQKFTEENYYPIRVDQNTVQQMQTDKGQDENLYAILHMGMTKSTNDLANNALIIGDIFDTFSRHVDNMSTYNAYAAPIADMLRWYNWKPVDGGDGTKTMLEKKFGKAGRDYIPTLIRDLNGQVSKSYTPGIMEDMTRKAKSASVGANIRVAVQQPTAIARALDMMSPKYILKGMTMNPKAMKKAIDLAQKYCPIAKWKSLGFYETHIGKGLRTLMFGGQTVLDEVTDRSMALAGKMDEVTWGALWRACEAETRELLPDLKGAELYRETGKRLGEIIDYTQVVDTPLHRSQLMRSKNYGAQMSTAFMSEPTKTYNMLEAAISRWAENRKDPVARTKVARALLVYAGTAALNAAFQSVWDAVRDSGTEKDFLEKILGKYMENLSDNLNPLGMIPIVSQVMDVLDGYDPSRMDMQAVQKVVQIGDQLKKVSEGKSNWTAAKWIQNVSSALSYMTGVPAGNLVRDLMAIYNTTSMALGGQPIAMTTTSTMTAEMQKSLYGALVSGNAKKWNRMIESMKDKSAADIDASLAKQMAEEDERIALAYEAKAAGNGPEALRIRKEIVGELAGFSMLDEKRLTEIVDKAVLTYGASVNPEKEKEEEEAKPLSAKLFRTEDGKNAVLGVAEGRMSVADAKLILSELAADSTAKDPEKSVRSTVLAEVKKDWTAAMKAGDDQKARRLEHAMVEVLGVPEDDPQKWRMDMNADDLRAEVKTGDKAKASKTVQKMRDEGLSDSDIKARLSPFKAEYISMVDSGDRQGAENLKRMLIGLGLKGKNGKDLYTDETFEAWTED